MLSDRIPLLDHGYLQYVAHMGSDEGIIEAARMSTGKGFLGWVRLVKCPECGREAECENKPAYCTQRPCVNVEMREVHPGDHKLLRYLWTEKPPHSTPFEMGSLVIEVKAPIMVFREWHRHRTQSYNEMSGRYVPLPDENYVPTVERMLLNSMTNKQAGVVKGADELTAEVANELRAEEVTFLAAAERFYQKKLAAGVPKELARSHIGVSRYSQMRASANLFNWLKFLTLRTHHKAQWEIRQYAWALDGLIKQLFPRTWALFDEQRLALAEKLLAPPSR